MDKLTINNPDGTLEVEVREEVIAIIAALAATETEGIYSMAGGITNEIIARLGWKNLAAGVNVELKEGAAIIDLALVAEMGANIPEVSERAQEKVAAAVENMTGLKVREVNVRIANVHIENS